MNEDAGELAFARLYDAHYGELLGYCRRRVGPADADDAVAEVLRVAWSKIDDLPGDAALRSWLLGIAYRIVGHHWRARDRYRRLRDRVAATPFDTPSGPEAVVVRSDQDRLVREAARRLRPADREILQLAGWEELPHAEIAAVLGTSVAAVDQRFHRAKQRLAREYRRLQSDAATEPETEP